jgi:hypothetical protein
MDLRDKYGVNKNLYKEVICPVCGQVTLDSSWICDNCNWEYDDTIDENEYSDANQGSIRDYKEKMGLLEIPNVRFNILPQNLLDFTECISILTNEIGIVGFDKEDFERIINNSHQVNFFSLSGDDMLKVADEFGRFVNYKNCMGGNMLFILTTNHLPKEAESIEKALDIASENLDIKNFCYNIYERNQEERFKAYVFVTEPNKSKLGDNMSN